MDASEAAIMEKFMAKEPKRQLNLADLIMSKIEESENKPQQDTDTHDPITPQQRKSTLEQFHSTLDPKVVEVYTKVGLLLARYRSGKLPKAFKIIPSLPQWEEVLFLTNPDGWTPHATYQATRIFVSNLGANLAQRFFVHVLLDRVRDDIAETKKLNYHLYMALKKGLYKPAAFFKGILFPLCESGTCTLREAAIIGSVLAKVSIPMEHSAAALLRMAEMEYTGPNSLFLRILLDKKYALPYKVVDAIVLHFVRFKSDHRPLPVLWHQCLLVFAQRYKANITEEQKEALMELIKVKYHPSISQEIRREFESAACRDQMALDI
ncbi:Bystin [Chytridium lagenaria]|nr:Bystin [Chytridium lagenaria]